MKKTLRKILKWTAIVLAILIVLMILLPIIFQKQIVQAVKDEANKNLNAVVDFKDYGMNLFSSFPNFSLSLDDVSVTGIGEFSKDTLVVMDALTVSVNLFSVISGDTYTIRRIQLDRPRVHLKVLPGGKANWDIAKPSADTTAATEDAEASKFKLSLRKLVINDADVLYEDYDAFMFARVDSLNHSLSGDLSADFTSLSTKTFIKAVSFSYAGIPYLKEARIILNADIDADLKNSKYTFKENEFGINELFLAFDGWLAMPDSNIDMDLKFSASQTEFKNILSLVPAIYMKDFESVKTSGTLSLSGFAKGTYSDAGWPAFEVLLDVSNGMFQYPDLPGSVNNITINGKASNPGGSEDKTIIDVKKIHLDMGGNAVDASLYVSTPVSDPNMDAVIKGKVDLSKIGDFYPLAEGEKLSGLFTADIAIKGRMSYLDQEAYEKFDAKGSLGIQNFEYSSKDLPEATSISKALLNFTPKAMELAYLEAKSGKSDFSMKGQVSNYIAYFFRDELLSGTFSLNSGLTDLNAWMSSGSEEAAAPAAEEEASEGGVIELPGNIDFTLNTQIAKVLYDQMEITDVSGTVGLKDRTAVMKDLKMNLCGGSLVLGGTYSGVNPLAPKVDFALDIRDFDIQQTLKNLPSLGKFAPIAEKTSGRFSAKAAYASVLTGDMSPDYGTVNASGKLQTRSIIIVNAGFFNKLSEELKIDLFRSITPADMSIGFKIVDGVVFSEPFDLKFSKSTLTIEGFMKLDESIQYVMKLSVPRSEFGGKANGVLDNLVSQAKGKGLDIKPGETVDIEILASGTVSKPVFKIGLKGSMGDLMEDLKDQAQQALEEKKEEIINEVKDQVNTALEEANQKAQQIIAEAEAKAQQIREEAKRAGDQLIAEAEAAGQKLIDEAKNPITKAAAKESAKKLKEEAQKKADKLNAEADKQATDLLNKARAEAEQLKNSAKQ